MDLTEQKALRDRYSARTEVLAKVKQLFLIPKWDMMTIRQVADYYEVDLHTITVLYQRNKAEIDSDGVRLETFKNVKRFYEKLSNLTTCDIRKWEQVKGKAVVCFDNNVSIEIPNRGIRLFSQRAVLRIGMLLRDSEVAKEVRTQLLNTFENATPEQRIKDLTDE